MEDLKLWRMSCHNTHSCWRTQSPDILRVEDGISSFQREINSLFFLALVLAISVFNHIRGAWVFKTVDEGGSLLIHQLKIQSYLETGLWKYWEIFLWMLSLHSESDSSNHLPRAGQRHLSTYSQRWWKRALVNVWVELGGQRTMGT